MEIESSKWEINEDVGAKQKEHCYYIESRYRSQLHALCSDEKFGVLTWKYHSTTHYRIVR